MGLNPETMREKDEVVLTASLKDPSLFKVLVDRYQEPFLRKARSVLKREEDVEDVVQETFVKLYKSGHTFKKRPDIEFKSWAYKILMNTSFTRYAKLRKEAGNLPFEDFFDAEGGNDIPDGEDYAAQGELRQGVQAVLAKMPVALADAMRLYYFDGKSYQDIAQEQRISLSSLKMRLFRARRLFRKIYEA